MIAYIRTMAVERKRWLDPEAFQRGVALCQSIPGATAIQMTAYIGLMLRGVPGAAAAFIGFGLPAFLLMTIMATIYQDIVRFPVVTSVFGSLQALIVAIVANAAFMFGRPQIRSPRAASLALASAGLYALKVHPILVVILAAGGGWALLPVDPPRSANRPEQPIRPTWKTALGIALCGIVLTWILGFFDPILRDLVFLMARIDLFAFGGGFAALPVMYHEIVTQRNWLEAPEFLDGIVLGQVTPGPIVITAAFIGRSIGGIPGAILATIGIFAPSFLLVVLLAPLFDRFRRHPVFMRSIAGVLCSFTGLLCAVTVQFAANVSWTAGHIVLAVSALAALLLKIDILWVVAVGLAASIVIALL